MPQMPIGQTFARKRRIFHKNVPQETRKALCNAGQDFSFACGRTGMRVARAREPPDRTVEAGWPRDRTDCRFYLIVLQTGCLPDA